MREIARRRPKSYTGAVTPNDPVRVYDCSGPWGDPAFTGTSEQGLPALRADWIRARGDVEEYDGREVKPQDNGYLSGKHAEYASKAEKNRLVEFPALTAQRRRPQTAPRRARSSRNSPTPAPASSRRRWSSSPSAKTMGRAKIAEMSNDIVRNDLNKQHAGSSQFRARQSAIRVHTLSIFSRFPSASRADHARIRAR